MTDIVACSQCSKNSKSEFMSRTVTKGVVLIGVHESGQYLYPPDTFQSPSDELHARKHEARGDKCSLYTAFHLIDLPGPATLTGRIRPSKFQ